MPNTRSTTDVATRAPLQPSLPRPGHALDLVHHALPVRAAMMGQIVYTLVATAALYRPNHAFALLIWSATSVGLATFILADWSARAATRLPRLTSPRFRRRSFQMAALLGGLWALLPLTLLGELRPREEIVLIALLLCACSSGAVLLAALKPAALTYASIILVPTAVKCLLVLPTPQYAGLGCVLLTYWAFLSGLVRIWSQLIESKARIIQDLEITTASKDEAERALATDLLTGVMNRRGAIERLDELEDRRGTPFGTPYALLILDFDRFKSVNDTLGRAIGDGVLAEIGKRLSAAVKPGDSVARLGADEFAVILVGTGTEAEARQEVDRIRAELVPAFVVQDHEITLTVSIGIALSTQMTSPDSELSLMAELALTTAKHDGGSRVRMFCPDMLARMKERAAIADDLHHAAARDELFLQYQPIFESSGRTIVAMEALLRWRRNGVLIPPSTFIPVAEADGSIIELGAWALRRACLDAASWPASIRLAVNLSPVQFYAPRMVDMVAASLKASGLAPERLELEIPGRVLQRPHEINQTRLDRLHALGVTLVMDDFGTGGASMAQIVRHPFGKLKIDRAYISRMGENTPELVVITAAVQLAHDLGLGIVAQGIECKTWQTSSPACSPPLPPRCPKPASRSRGEPEALTSP